jgi:hypothetical protein
LDVLEGGGEEVRGKGEGDVEVGCFVVLGVLEGDGAANGVSPVTSLGYFLFMLDQIAVVFV